MELPVPPFSQEMAQKTLARKARFLDAGVAGSKVPVEQGSLRFFVGGEAADFEACLPLFKAMGSEAIHIGGYGMGITGRWCLT